jgi:acetoacetate decarboxylase
MGFVYRIGELKPGASRMLDGKLLQIIYRTTPEKLVKVIPPPLEPTPNSHVTLLVATYGKTDFGAPAYNEAGIFPQVKYKDIIGSYCLSMILDDDIALLRGREIFGFPKKMGEVSLQKDGNHVIGLVRRRGKEVVRLTAELNPSPTRQLISTSAFGKVTYTHKYCFNPELTGFDYPPRLVEIAIEEETQEVETGEGQIQFERSSLDSWFELTPEEILSTVYKKVNIILPPARVISEVEPKEFLPYAFARSR